MTDWPGGTPLRFRPHGDGFTLDSTFDYDSIESVYVHVQALFRPYDPLDHEDLDDRDDIYSALDQRKEYRSLFASVCQVCESEGIAVLPEEQNYALLPEEQNYALQERKPWQLRLFEQQDLPIPDTLFKNDPDEVRAFYDDHDEVIYKPTSRGAPPTVVEEEDLSPGRRSKVETAPVQFQEFVPGNDLRVYVLDGEVVGAMRYESEAFSFKIDQHENRSVDVTAATISGEVRETAVQAAEALGLTFGAADFRLTPDGDHRLLELNPAPANAGADEFAGQNVATAVADYLTDPDRSPGG